MERLSNRIEAPGWLLHRRAALVLPAMLMLALRAGEPAHAKQAQPPGPPFPVKAMRMVVPTAPGGNADIVAHIAADGMTRILGQAVVVDNQPGGRHIPASLMVSRAQPDGYTLLQAGSVMSVNASLYRLPYDPLRDFAPVGMVGATPPVLAAWAGLPANNVAELIALARARPDSLHVATAG